MELALDFKFLDSSCRIILFPGKGWVKSPFLNGEGLESSFSVAIAGTLGHAVQAWGFQVSFSQI